MDPRAVIVCADHDRPCSGPMPPPRPPPSFACHAVTGLARTAALLRKGAWRPAGSPAISAPHRALALKLDTLETIIIAWPESFSAELDTLLGEAPEARRVILSLGPSRAHRFHRAPRAPGRDHPVDIPLDPVESRWTGRVGALSPWCGRSPCSGVRDVLDAVRSIRPYVWTGGRRGAGRACRAVVATRCRAGELRTLAAIAQPLVVALASRSPISSRSRRSRRPVAVPRPIARRIAMQRAGANLGTLTQATWMRSWRMLAPLFRSTIRRWSRARCWPSVVSHQSSVKHHRRSLSKLIGSELFVTGAQRDRASAKDLVGALIKEAGLQKGQIGKIDVRETFSLVDVAPHCESGRAALSGVSIRGRRVTARPDRAENLLLVVHCLLQLFPARNASDRRLDR